MNNPKTRQQWILDELKHSPNTSFSEMFSRYSEKFSKSEKTFSKDWKRSITEHLEYQKNLKNEKEKVSIKKEVEAIENGLETKIQRLFSLQKRKIDIEKMLTTGTYLEHKFSGTKAVKIERPLTPQEVSSLTKTFQLLSSEISKIEGDYAETKVKHSGDENNPVHHEVNINVVSTEYKIANSEEEIDV